LTSWPHMFQEPKFVDRKWTKRTASGQQAVPDHVQLVIWPQTDDLLQVNPLNRFRYFRLAHTIKICNLESLWTFLKYENIIFQKEFRKYLIWLIWLSQNQNSENHSTCQCLFCSSPNLNFFIVSRYPPIWSVRGALIKWHDITQNLGHYYCIFAMATHVTVNSVVDWGHMWFERLTCKSFIMVLVPRVKQPLWVNADSDKSSVLD